MPNQGLKETLKNNFLPQKKKGQNTVPNISPIVTQAETFDKPSHPRRFSLKIIRLSTIITQDKFHMLKPAEGVQDLGEKISCP
jgi:hypothetical protein